MIPIVVSATAFKNNESACLHRIKELIQTKPDSYTGLLLDENFLKQNSVASTEMTPASRIHLSDWVDDTQQPLSIRIRAQANSLCTNQIVLLDVRHYDAHVISHVLHVIGKIWFHLKTWQPAFALVVDDHHAPQFTRELSTVFYIQPLPTSKQAIQAELRNIRMYIRGYRWLGFKRMGRAARLLRGFMHKVKRYAHRKIS